MDVSITKIHLDTFISMTSIFEQREYTPTSIQKTESFLPENSAIPLFPNAPTHNSDQGIKPLPVSLGYPFGAPP